MEEESRVRRFFRLPQSRSTIAREIDDEIAFHIEARIADLVEAGESPENARRSAEREFGDVSAARSELASIDRVTLGRERRAAWWDALRQDTRLALAGMRRNPTFTLTLVLTLALGIGVNAAMFGITDRLLLSAPPHVADADEVVRVLYQHTLSNGERTFRSRLPYPDYELLQTVGGFDELGAFSTGQSVLGRGAAAAEIRRGQATATFFTLLGVQPALGRFFSAEEDAPPRGIPVVVLSHALWHGRFGGDEGVLGTVVEIGHIAYEVIGVAPRGFTGVDLEAVDAWVPVSALGPHLAGEEWYAFRGMHYLQVLARLGDGIDAAVAQEQASAVFVAGNEERFAGDSTARVILGSVIAARAPAIGEATPQRSGRIALWLLGVSLIVVVIACVNVINLLLARGMRQRRETGVRLALGISRARLAAQTLTETLLIASISAVLGLLLAHWGGQLARGALLPDVEWTGGIVSGRVALFTGAVTLACALIASIAPSLYAARSHVSVLLGLGGRSTYRRSRVRSGLVSLQATLSVLLLVGAGLFLRSLNEAGRIALGYEADRVAILSWNTSGLDWEHELRLSLYQAALERVRNLPQFESASLSSTQPLWGTMYGYVRVPGIDSIPTTRDIIYTSASPDYFRTVGARILQGREFTSDDVTGAPRVAVITESLARVLWPGQGAIGRCFMTSPQPDAACREVVGIVEDTRYSSVLDEPAMMFYLPMAQTSGRSWMGGVFVRLRGDGKADLSVAKAAMQSLEPGLPHVQVTVLSERVAPALQPWRLGAVMFTAFGILALVLASVGLYGVVAYDVAQRRRELGVRVALGARAANVLRMVLGDAVRVVVLGLVLGIAAALIAARYIEPLLFRVESRDPLVHAGVAVLLLTITVLAGALPAWRAARVQPTEALRDDR